MRGEGGRPARRRWCDVTASGIWWGKDRFVSGACLFGFVERVRSVRGVRWYGERVGFGVGIGIGVGVRIRVRIRVGIEVRRRTIGA